MSTNCCAIFFVLLYCGNPLSAQLLAIRSNELPWAIKGAPYLAEVVTSTNGRCPLGDVGLTVMAGQLPKGLELFSFGIQGTPTQMGRFRFTLKAANTCAVTAKTFDLLVTGKPILLVSPRQITLQYRVGSSNWPEDTIRVEGSWPEQPYSIDVSQAPWLRVEPVEGKLPGVESVLTGDRVHIRVNPSELVAGVYHASIKFYMQGGENAPVVQVTLQVLKDN